MTTTRTTIQTGDRVCRRGSRYKVVGTVIRVVGLTARVDWDKYQGGGTRLGSGRGHDSSVKVAALCLESEFVARPISGPAESDWAVTGFRVACDHPSGEWMSESGVNDFWTTTEADARAKAAELVAAGRTNTRVSRQDQADWVPAGCRNPRQKWRWTTLEL